MAYVPSILTCMLPTAMLNVFTTCSLFLSEPYFKAIVSAVVCSITAQTAQRLNVRGFRAPARGIPPAQSDIRYMFDKITSPVCLV